jgi:hypothetical protein
MFLLLAKKARQKAYATTFGRALNLVRLEIIYFFAALP